MNDWVVALLAQRANYTWEKKFHGWSVFCLGVWRDCSKLKMRTVQ